MDFTLHLLTFVVPFSKQLRDHQIEITAYPPLAKTIHTLYCLHLVWITALWRPFVGGGVVFSINGMDLIDGILYEWIHLVVWWLPILEVQQVSKLFFYYVLKVFLKNLIFFIFKLIIFWYFYIILMCWCQK